MERVVNILGYTGTEQPYVMVSRATSLSGVIVLRDFEDRQIVKWRSEESGKEFARLTYLKWQTIVQYGDEAEIEEAKKKMAEITEKTAARGTKPCERTRSKIEGT